MTDDVEDASYSDDVLTEGNVAGVEDNQDLVAQENKNSEVGEAVLATNGISSDYFTKNKLKREQTRAQSEEALKEIINNSNIAEEQKQDAIDKMIALTSIKEKETVTETLLEAKGFSEALVTITDDSVEVVVNANNLSEQQIAQIEDVVKRKTGISAKNIVISPANVLEESAATEEETSGTLEESAAIEEETTTSAEETETSGALEENANTDTSTNTEKQNTEKEKTDSEKTATENADTQKESKEESK